MITILVGVMIMGIVSAIVFIIDEVYDD